MGIPINEDEDRPETFDLSADVDLSTLTDADLLFRESIIKAFYESATRTGKPVWGYTTDSLQKMQDEIIEEFKNRGRNYLVPLDRSTVNKKSISRSAKEIKKSKTKDFFRFVSDMEVRLREHEFETGMCHHCDYFSNMRCGVLEHIVSQTQVCDAYSGQWCYDDDDRKYVIGDLNGFMKGLMEFQPFQKTFVRMLDAPTGMLLIFKDNMPNPHYFSITMNEFIESTIRNHHWTQEEVDSISGSGGMNNE